MNDSDYLNISNDNVIEEFTNSSGAVGGGAFGSGSVSNAHSPGSRSPSSISQGGGKQYGSFGYASVNPLTGSMSGLADVQPGGISGLGVVKKGAKTGTFTGGSFNGYGREVVGFPGIQAGGTLPASSSPSLYMKPKLTPPHPTFFDTKTVQDVTLPYGHIEKHTTPGIPGPRITNKYDNVGCNFATKLRGPRFPYGFDLRDKNLTGLYNYRGFGYYYDPFYWGNGPMWPLTGVSIDYPDPPYNYEDLMQKEVNADYMVNTIQNQLATQFMEEDAQKEALQKEEIEELNENSILKDPTDKKTKPNAKEVFGFSDRTCGRNTILIILAVVLIAYILLNMTTSETEKRFSL